MGAAIDLTAKIGQSVYGTPAYEDGVVWFRGQNDKLWRLDLDKAGETGAIENPQGVTCLAAPTIGANAIYFQGAGNKLIKMLKEWPYLHGALESDEGELTCTTPPVVANDGHVYYNSNGSLMRADVRGRRKTVKLAADVVGSPAILLKDNRFLYYTNVRNEVYWALLPSGPMQARPGADGKPGAITGNDQFQNVLRIGFVTADRPPLLACCDGGLYVLDQGRLWRFERLPTATRTTDPETGLVTTTVDYNKITEKLVRMSSVSGALAAFHWHMDGYVYFKGADNKLVKVAMSALKDEEAQARVVPTQVSDKAIGAAPCPGPPGYMLCQGADNHLYQIPTS